MPASGHEFMCGPLSVLYITIVSSASPCSSQVLQQLPDHCVMVDHRVVVVGLPPPGLPATLFGLTCVRKCMCVVLNHTKNGVFPP